jgi:hypothetical protein
MREQASVGMETRRARRRKRTGRRDQRPSTSKSGCNRQATAAAAVNLLETRSGPDPAGHDAVHPKYAVLAVLGTLACGSTLPQPIQTAPPPEAFVEVPYPPPPALSELVPQAPNRPGVVFIDGGWTWRGKYYVWQRGGWVQPKPGLRQSLWTVRYTEDGRALFAESRWVDARGRLARGPRIIVPSGTPPNEVTAEFQTGR